MSLSPGDLPSAGEESRRPAIVIQTDAANTNTRYPNTIVLTLSTKGLNVATHVRIEPDRSCDLKETRWAKCEQILTISKDRLTTLWGSVSAEDMVRIESATKTALALR